jgi:hypothetical protein
MKTRARDLRADWHTPLRGHLMELARYCGVTRLAVGWWCVAGVPAVHRRAVARFACVAAALERRYDPHFACTLLRLFARAAEERSLLRSWRLRQVRHSRYRVVVRR